LVPVNPARRVPQIGCSILFNKAYGLACKQSTVLKQMKLINQGAYTEQERDSYKEIIVRTPYTDT